MEAVLECLQGISVEKAADEKLCDLDYAKYFTCLFESSSVRNTHQTESPGM